MSEGMNSYRSTAPGSKWGMDREPSYGPFQLLVGKGTGGKMGMGDDFISKTGLDPRDPSTWRQQVDFALDHAKQKGWGAWYGAARVGIGDRQGLNITPYTYTPQTDPESVSKTSYRSGGFYGNDEQCVALSKHFSGLGAASGWKVKQGNITPGTVIATMSYNDGSGGKMARNMPDGKSHYHTGIALSTPNEKGEVLILEQFAGQPARVRSVNINNYNGESWGVVEGGGPSAGTMKAVEIGRGLANPDQLAWIQSSTGQTAAQKGQPSIEVKPAQEAGVAKPTLTTNQVPPQYPEDQQQQAPAQSAKVEKPDKSKKTSETYKFDPDKYWKEVVTKQPMADSMLYGKDKVMQETYKGFQEAQDAGAIKWNRKTNEIQILDPNHEKIQQIYQDMQNNNIDRNAFLSKTEAGDGGTAKVGHVKRNRAAGAVDRYSPDVTLTGLSKDSNLIDYSNSKAAKAIGVTDQQYNAFREALASIESSGGKYGLRGGSSKRFSGAYQIGGRELQEVAKRLGEEAPVMKVKGKKTPVASEQFLKDPHMQERYFDEYVTMHHERLMKNKRYAALSPEEKLKIQGMAHNAGAGAASRYLRTGSISRDAAGTHPEKYAHRIGAQLAGLNSARETAIASTKQTTPQAGPAPTTPMTATAAVTPTEPETAVADRSVSDRMRAAVSPLIGPPAATAAPKKEERQPTGAIDTAPSDFVMPAATTPPAAKSDQHSMLMEKPQNPVSINPLEQRPAHMQPTPSMARAMDNARGVVNTSYTSLSKTNLG